MHMLNELLFNNFVMFFCVFLLTSWPPPFPSVVCTYPLWLLLLTFSITFPHLHCFLLSLFPFTLSWPSHFHTHIIYLHSPFDYFHSLPTLSSPPHLFPTTVSSSLYHYQTSASVFGLNTWSMSPRSVMVSPQTSSSHWSGSLSCLVKPTRCCVQETWVLSSATSSLQSWTTSRPSGATTWVELCWRLWRESSSPTLCGWQRAQRASAYWSAWTKMTMRRAEGCWKLDKCCHPIMVQQFKTPGWNRTYEDCSS